VREADLTTFMCPMSWKSGSLNLLEPSEPHQACYGTALLYFIDKEYQGIKKYTVPGKGSMTLEN